MSKVSPFFLIFVLVACSGAPDLQALRDPENCKSCHPRQFEEWSGSMHAYASFDPVFLAMNKRGQEETNGQLGNFCVNCHAPMAVRDGLTKDGLNLETLEKKYQGVTCYFCHQIDAVEGDNNAQVHIADDGVMRGSFDDAASNDMHESMASSLHDRTNLESSKMCGACHDIVNSNGVALERTFAEWKETLFAKPGSREPFSCASCHMVGMNGIAAENVSGVKFRRVKSHTFPGVDLALTPFPELEDQKRLVQRELDPTLLATCEVRTSTDGIVLFVFLDNNAAGHSFPSGAAQDRRAWLEVIATFQGREVFRTGVVADDQPLSSIAATDPSLVVFGDKLFDASDREVHMFWEAARVESNLIGGAVTRDELDVENFRKNHTEHIFRIRGPRPDLITIRVRLRPMEFDVLDDLIASGHLDPQIRGRMNTFELHGTKIEWRPPEGPMDPGCVPSPE